MTEKFKEFKTLIDGVESRKRAAEDRAHDLRNQVAALELDFDTASITGAPTDHITEKLDALREDFERADRAAGVFRKAPGELMAVIKSNPRISQLAKEVLNDNAQQLADMQSSYDQKLKMIQQIKADLLQVIRELGALAIKAGKLTAEQRSVAKYIPGYEKTYFHGLTRNDPRGDGPDEIFLNAGEIRKAYKGGEAV